MAANGRGHMRPNTGSRTPSFLLVGLFVVIGILAFNYWSVSSKNNELSVEVDDVGLRYRSMQAQKIDLEKRNEDLSKRTADMSAEIERYKNAITEKDEKIDQLERRGQELNDKIDAAARELQNEQEVHDACSDEVGFLKENITKLVNAHKNALDEATRLCVIKVDEAKANAERRASEVEKPDQQQLLLEQQQKEKEEKEKAELERLKFEQENLNQQVVPPNADIKPENSTEIEENSVKDIDIVEKPVPDENREGEHEVSNQGLPPQSNDLSLAARQGYQLDIVQPGAQSHDQQVLSHDQQVLNRDQQYQSRDLPLQPYVQSVQSNEQLQSHDQRVQPYDQVQLQNQQGQLHGQQSQYAQQDQHEAYAPNRDNHAPGQIQNLFHDQNQYKGPISDQVQLNQENRGLIQNKESNQDQGQQGQAIGGVVHNEGEIDIDQGRDIDERVDRSRQHFQDQVEDRLGDPGKIDLQVQHRDSWLGDHDTRQGEPRIQLQQQEDQGAYVNHDQGDEADEMNSRLKFAELQEGDEKMGNLEQDEEIIENMRHQQLPGQNFV